MIRRSKQLYYKSKSYENKNNIKGTWDVLNTLIKQRSSESTYPDYFIDGDREPYNIYNIVNSFNEFFVKVCPELAAEILDHDMIKVRRLSQRIQCPFYSQQQMRWK